MVWTAPAYVGQVGTCTQGCTPQLLSLSKLSTAPPNTPLLLAEFGPPTHVRPKASKTIWAGKGSLASGESRRLNEAASSKLL